MARVGILFASTWGHTRAIAERLGAAASARGAEVSLHDLGAGDPGVPEADRLVLVGAVYSNEHHPALVGWLKAHRGELAGRDVRLVSSSLAVALGTDEGEGAAWDYVGELEQLTGVKLREVTLVAGALAESRYDPSTRALLRVASWRSGLGTTGDDVFTDWSQVDAIGAKLAG